jgi:hypothetical protein
VILPVLFAVLILSVPLAGGRLGRLAQLELRGTPLLYLALAIQVLIIEVLPDASYTSSLHLATYGLALAFLVANNRLPGMEFIALGAAANVAAIVANDGVMPASERALRIAGRTGEGEHFVNSTHVADANLSFLGDVYAIPAHLPLANVFSPGDVLLLVGGAVALHIVCESRLTRAGRERAGRERAGRDVSAPGTPTSSPA